MATSKSKTPAKAPAPAPTPPKNPLVDPARVEPKLGAYGTATAAALVEVTPWQEAQEYRRRAAARMQPIEKKDLRGRLPAGEYHLSRKVDGEFTVVWYKDGQAVTVNPGGTVRVGLPFLTELEKTLKKAGVQSALVAGELYYRHEGGARPRVHDVSRAARKPESAADLERLCFAVFDLIALDGGDKKPLPGKFSEVFARLSRLFAGGQRVHPVDSAVVKSVEEIEQHFASWVEQQGGEGLVLRSDSTGTFKLKPRHTLDVAVVGFTEGTDDRKGMLHDLLVAVMRKDGSLHLLGHVGGGFSDEERRALLSDLKDRVVASDYAEIGDDHVAYQMVRPEWVIEISCLDLISQTTRGGAIDKMVVSYDAATGRYSPVRRLPLASLISPNFVRRREDKRVNETDVRIAQLTDLVEIARTEVDARNVTLPKSRVLRREVYTKSMKGNTLVRKLLLWQTNKDQEEGGEFPAFVLHYTDYSPTRESPLKREIRVSSSREQIDALWAELEKEYLAVKGWARTA